MKMRNLFLAAVMLAAAAGCRKPGNSVPSLHPTAPRLVLLKVDYLTHQFEGGKVFDFPATAATPDSIPLAVTYRPPGDFGNITLTYAPTGDTVLDGGIIWMGLGILHQPTFAPAGSFGTTAQLAPKPDSNRVQAIYPGGYAPSFLDSTIRNAWTGVANLAITHQMVGGGAKAGLFLYTPSVGIGNPADWDYIWMLYLNPAGS